jgi:hypothetical protein
MNDGTNDPTGVRCCNCRYVSNEDDRLCCKRYPPTEYKRWPVVVGDDWCGEFNLSVECIKDQFKGFDLNLWQKDK